MTIRKYFDLPDVEHIFINSQTDPRLIFRGFVYNAYDVEDRLVADYCDYCDDDPNLENFSGWIRNNTESIYKYLHDLESRGVGIPVSDDKLYTAEKFFSVLEKSLTLNR